MRSEQRLARLLRMVPYLASHPGVEVATVASTFGVTESQVIGDLEVLQFCGLPGGYVDDLFDVDIEAVREEGRIDFRNAEVLSRPLRLRTAEAASLLAALRLVVDMAGTSDAAASALAKLESAVGAAEDHLMVRVEPSDPGLRAAIGDAIDAALVIRLSYRRPGAHEQSTADVEPARIRLVDGYSYLDAWSRPRAAWRSFRLDRISAATATKERFEPRQPPTTPWFDDVAERLSITVKAAAGWICEYYPTTSVERHDDRLMATFPVASREWAVALLLRLGDEVLDVSDLSLLEDARRRAGAALAHYRPEVQ